VLGASASLRHVHTVSRNACYLAGRDAAGGRTEALSQIPVAYLIAADNSSGLKTGYNGPPTPPCKGGPCRCVHTLLLSIGDPRPAVVVRHAPLPLAGSTRWSAQDGSVLHGMLFFENLIRALLIFNGLRGRYCQ
jgi:hypothetical protein